MAVTAGEGGLQVVWFKRDLRVRDHAPLWHAAQHGPVLGLYVYEPELWAQPDSHGSHLAFVGECLTELQAALEAIGGRLLIVHGAMPEVLDRLHAALPFARVWAHMETGNLWTYRRDERVIAWARRRGIPFAEIPQQGVVRRLRNRDHWARHYRQLVDQPMVRVPKALHAPELPPSLMDVGVCTPTQLGREPARPGAQRGGEREGWKTLQSFLEERGAQYATQLSSPGSAGMAAAASPRFWHGGPCPFDRFIAPPDASSEGSRSGVGGEPCPIPDGRAASRPTSRGSTGTATSSRSWSQSPPSNSAT